MIKNKDIKYIQKSNDKITNWYDKENNYPLAFACVNNALYEIIYKLVNKGANIIIYDKINECILLNGLYKFDHFEKNEIAKLLFDCGVDVNGIISNFEIAKFNESINGIDVKYINNSDLLTFLEVLELLESSYIQGVEVFLEFIEALINDEKLEDLLISKD